MLTSKLKHHHKPEVAPYPCLMEDRGLVVLFSTHNEGTVIAIAEGSGGYVIGYHSTKWSKSSFIPYRGEVIISTD